METKSTELQEHIEEEEHADQEVEYTENNETINTSMLTDEDDKKVTKKKVKATKNQKKIGMKSGRKTRSNNIVGPTTLSLREEKEVKPWEDPALKINDKDYHVRKFWTNMTFNWVKPQKTPITQLAESESSVVYSGIEEAAPLHSKKVFDSKSLVDSINRSKLGWTATEYSFLAGKTFEEINMLAGRYSGSRRSMAELVKDRPTTSFAKSDSQLPSDLDLGYLLSPPRRQRSCGNCYLIATVGMLEARIRMKYGKSFPLSVQYLNDCNHYAQGCNGGFSLEVLRFAEEFWAPPEDCKPFYAAQGVCGGHCEVSKLPEVVTVSRGYYVGEFFGKTTEQLLMDELMDNGPVVVSFEPKPSFTYYKSGIYRPLEDTVEQGFQGNRQWMKVDHSVLLYGWGEEDGVRFWRVQNSWGASWGENGTFKIIRGQNVLGIESLGEAAVPKIVPM